MKKVFASLLVLAFVLFCAKNIKDTPNLGSSGASMFGTKKPYQCKKIDFYKGAKLDHVPKGKCAGSKDYPDDIPIEVNFDREKAKKYYANKNFPGKISPSVKRETVQFEIEYPLPIWNVTTGAYAAPDEEIELEVPEELTKNKLELQIGIHSDNVSHVKEALRDGVVVVTKKIDSTVIKMKNKRGGTILLRTRLLYSDTKDEVPWWLPYDAIRNNKILSGKKYKLTLRNVIRAPKFVLGKTTPQQWVDEERCNPAPWAELEGKNITIGVPSSVIRNLNNPEPVLNFWDTAVKSATELTGRDDVMHLTRERFVTDVDISIGFMHSGNPIMTYLISALDSVDQEAKDKSKPWSPENSELMSDYVLGHFHELAHNRQSGDPWITANLGEWSTNIFVTKMNCEVLGHEPEDLFKKYGEDPRYAAYRFFQGDESVYDNDLMKKWKNKYAAISHTKIPNLFYIHLYNNFGFDIYKKIITHYQKMKQEEWDKDNYCKNGKEPNCNYNRLNSFALELSKITGMDMTDYLNYWGYELTWGADEIKKLNLPKFKPTPILAGFNLSSTPIKEGVYYDIASLKSNGALTINVKGRATWDGAEILTWSREFNIGHTMFQFKKTQTGNSEFQIIGKDSNLCVGMDKDDKNLALRNCDPNSLSQIWKIDRADYGNLTFHSFYNMGKKKYISVSSNLPKPGDKVEFISENKNQPDSLWILSDSRF